MKESLFSDVLETLARSVAEEEVRSSQQKNKGEFDRAALTVTEDILDNFVHRVCQEVAQESQQKHAQLIRSKNSFQQASNYVKDDMINQMVSSLISEIANNQLTLEYEENQHQFAEAAELCNVSLIEKLVYSETLEVAEQ